MSAFAIRFRGASVGPIGQPIFRDFDWSVEPLQSWGITGPNGSGKSALAQALAGGLLVTSRAASSGQVPTILPSPDSVALISFERQRDVFFDERYHDDGEFVEGGVDPGTSARAFVLGQERGAPPVVRAVIKQPPLLILDEPCHGLDARHRQAVLTIANTIGEHSDSTILYVTHDPAERLACTRQLVDFDAEHGWVLSTVPSA